MDSGLTHYLHIAPTPFPLGLHVLIGFPDENLSSCAGFGRQASRTGRCETNRIAGMEHASPFKFSASFGNKDMHIRCVGNLHRFPRIEPSAPEHGPLLLDGNRRLMTTPTQWGSAHLAPALY